MSAGLATQRTLESAGSLSGSGLHTGKTSSVSFKPAKAGAGICFFKNARPVPLTLDPGSRRSSTLGQNGNRIQTVEHLLSALKGLGIDNLIIEVDGDEIPALDGSALGFVKLFKKLGIKELPAAKDTWRITEPLFYGEPGKAIAAYPAPQLRLSYVLDYEEGPLKSQKADYCPDPETFEREIAPARTFCTETEAARIREIGLGLGANTDNTLVISKEGPVGNTFRFPDECARHKLLDMLGDLGTLNFSLEAHVVGIRSGHSLNRRLVEGIKNIKESHGKKIS